MIKIGVICPSEIAYRRFMPSLKKVADIEYVGVAMYSQKERFENESVAPDLQSSIMDKERKKVTCFREKYGGKIYNSYQEIIETKEIDAVYIPLPPALHYKWAKSALEQGKHVLVEKPATIDLASANELITLALEKNLAFYENYMFVYHNQLDEIRNLLCSGVIGNIRLYKIAFGFPRRSQNDFRYNKKLGGGALLDAGGYTLKYANLLLGSSAKIICADLNNYDDSDVDIFGTATLKNKEGVIAQLSFGMDNYYKCELTAWGSIGELTTGRVLTAPAGYTPIALLKTAEGEREIKLSPDDTFIKSIQEFKKSIHDESIRKNQYNSIIQQAKIIEAFKEKANECI